MQSFQCPSALKSFQYYVCLSHMFPLITQPVLDTAWCSLLCSDLNLFCVDKYKVHISTYKDESQESQVTISWTPHFKCSIVFQFFETTVFELEMGSYLPCSALCSHMWHHCLGQRDTRARRLRRAPSFSNATAPPCIGEDISTLSSFTCLPLTAWLLLVLIFFFPYWWNY